jgi:hypothetical protein
LDADFHEQMFDTLFPFIDSILNSMEDDWFHFIAQVEALFEHPEQFQSEYQKLKASAGIHLSEEGQKLLDMQIGLTLIGQEGRRRMAERIRLIYTKYKLE